MSFFNKLVKNNETYIIAEACDNHMGSYDIATALVDSAAHAGANAVKFQHHLAYEEMLENAPMSDNFSEPLFNFLERNSLTLHEHNKLKIYCDKKNITYLCTPFSFKAAEEINHLVPFFKIGSGEFQDHWFIDNLEKLNKPVLFSTGMCSWQELKDNVAYLKKTNIDFALMNCLSEYPPKYEDMNLNLIEKMIKSFPGISVGHSDHSPEIYTSIVAASLGAKIIEKHLTVSKFVPGPDQSVSIEPSQFRDLVSACSYIKKTLGDQKLVHDKESDVRTWAYRSVVTTNLIEKGKIITETDICSKRPGTGIPSVNYKNILGKRAVRDIDGNTLISWEDLSE